MEKNLTLKTLVLVLVAGLALSCALLCNQTAFATENPALAENTSKVDTDQVEVSSESDAATIQNASFAVSDFTRAQKGSNREIDGQYVGYSYYQGTSTNYSVAISTKDYVLVYVPQTATTLCDTSNEKNCETLKSYFIALDNASPSGGVILSTDVPWYFTNDKEVTLNNMMYRFDVEVSKDKFYVTVLGSDGSDIISQDTTNTLKPTHVDFLTISEPSAVAITQQTTGLAAFWEFLTTVNLDPLWVTLKTTGVSIIFIFILGLMAAYFTLRIPKQTKDIADTIFTIPMVLPPTVCGFLLLLALGNNSPFGTWLTDLGIHLTFSWEATVVAAVVVAFPLMYRSARGAFENLDTDMLDAARTLGWSNIKIFLKLMLPLSWSSIAAGTVLAFARALGEFGATLFLAGNYAGITRTIPIAIYFEWMSGNLDVAVFWTVVIIIFSFLVILLINLWSRRTTKYRRKVEE